MNKQEKFHNMWEAQQELNTLIDPDWEYKDREWYRAVYVELVESIGHYGYKWWKKEERDIEQTVLELVDCLHFCLSDLKDIPTVIKPKPLKKDYVTNVEYILEDLFGDYYHDAGDVIFDILDLCVFIGYDFDAVYEIYMGKMQLNIFRQKNGYQDGTYIKNWFGKEDNEVLTSCINSMRLLYVDFDADLLYNILTEEYQKVLDDVGLSSKLI